MPARKLIYISLFLLLSKQALAINYYNKAIDVQEKGYFYEAINYYQLELKRNPHHYQAKTNMAVLQFQLKDIRSAVKSMKSSLKQNPFSIDSNYNMGLMLKKIGKLDEAAIHFEKVRKLRPGHFDSQYQLAHIYSRMKRFKLADNYFQKVIAMKPREAIHTFDYAKFLADHNKTSQAQTYFVRTLQLAPGDFQVNLQYALLLDAQTDRYKDTIAQYKKVLDLDKTNIQSRYNLARNYELISEENEAYHQYEKILEHSPAFHRAYYRMGVIDKNRGNHSQAIGLFNKTLQYNPKHVESHEHIAAIYVGQQKYDLAAEEYYKITTFKPNHTKAYIFRGWLHELLGHPNKAIRSYKKAISLDQANKSSHKALANIYFSMEKWYDAKPIYEKILRLDPNDSTTRYNLGQVFQKLKKPAMAAYHYGKVKPGAKDYEQAQKSLATLHLPDIKVNSSGNNRIPAATGP